MVLGVALAIYVVGARTSFDGVGGAGLMVLVALGLYAVWVLASAAWSNSPARAQVAFDRALLYLLLIALLAVAPVRVSHLRAAAAWIALAIVVVCGAGLISRLLPDVLATSSPVAHERLAYPVTYWNALGVLAALGVTLCAHLTAAPGERRSIRVAAAAALPILATTLFFTFSRGAILTAAVGLAAYLAVGRPRLLLPALVAALPTVAVALVAAYDADLLATAHPATSAATAQGHHVAWMVAGCIVVAALVRAALGRVDARIERRELAAGRPRRLTAAIAAAATVIVLVAALALGLPGAVSREYHGFVQGNNVQKRDLRTRLSDPGNNGRLDLWKTSLRGFRHEPVAGHGAGTFALLWEHDRPNHDQVVNGHSLYLETLAELGVVGFVLIVAMVLSLLVASLRRARGPDRAVYGAAFAVTLAWALHAGIDWDWEMPVVTVAPLALGALAGARSPETARRWRPLPATGRILAGIGCLLLLITPASIALSQGHLNASTRAFTRGDCRGAIGSALAASDAASTRPEPFEVIGFCDSRLGQDELARTALASAIRRDPGDWEYHYGMALVRAAGGLDPRAEAARALQLNPHEPLALDAVRAFRTGSAARWRAYARRAPLPIG